ncbi:MAG: hypothetical protein F4004_06475 [Acidimicrobiia bacterium]|nr:hypothetical protein [Acidimicrobiia bacterium]
MTSTASTAAPAPTIAPPAPATTAAIPPTSATGIAPETAAPDLVPSPTSTTGTATSTTAGTAPAESATTTSTAVVSAAETSTPGDPPDAETTGAAADPEAGDGSSADPEAPADVEPPEETDTPIDVETPASADAPVEAEVETAPSTGSAGAAAGLGDSLYPLLGNGGHDVLHYRIELDVDPGANALSARTTITALATEDMPAFNLDLSGLEVQDVTVDGVAAEFSRAGSELTVRPGLALVQGEEFSVSVGYSGTPSRSTTRACRSPRSASTRSTA